jgi:hypothetical protein
MYQGLTFGLVFHPQFAPEVYLQGAITRLAALSGDHHGPRAVLNALERLAGGYRSECDRVRQDLSIAEAQRRDYQLRLGTPFLHEEYLSELATLREKLKLVLSGAPPEVGAGPLLSAADLAEQIRALRAAHTIEATPQRAGKRCAAAEEPVTARIRRRAGQLSFADRAAVGGPPPP